MTGILDGTQIKADFGDLLNEDVKVRNFLEKELKDAYISRVEIERTARRTLRLSFVVLVQVLCLEKMATRIRWKF